MKVLVITGPTATGKTALALRLAQELNGELVSADSRQVYIGADIVTGKDIPPHFCLQPSPLTWQGQALTYYTNDHVRIWLYDVVPASVQFNVSYWLDCANLVINNIHSRHKLPIVVGATGLYIKALTHNLSHITTPPNPQLRYQLQDMSPAQLYAHLCKVNPHRAAALNASDRANPRRLIRAIEISTSIPISPVDLPAPNRDYLVLGLTCPRSDLYARIDERVSFRIAAGAQAETQRLVTQFGWDAPGLNAAGFQVWHDPDSARTRWAFAEHHDARRQAMWLNRYPHPYLLNVAQSDYLSQAESLVSTWYNLPSAKKD